MKPLLTGLAVTTALSAPAMANAATLTLDTTLRDYGGEDAYLAYYVTDADGNYVRTLWVASGKSRWWDHLTAWYSATGGSSSEINGLSGASVGSGRSLEVSVEIEDSLIDAGYEIRVDAAVEHQPNSPAEISVPLTTDNAGTSVSGRGYIDSFSFGL